MEEIPDDDGEMVQYHSCPLLWLKNPLMEYFEMRKHLKEHPHTEVPYFARRPRYVACDKYFTSTVAEFEDLKKAGT